MLNQQLDEENRSVMLKTINPVRGKLWYTEKIQGSTSLRIFKHINRMNMIIIKNKQKTPQKQKEQTKTTKRPQQPGNSTLLSYALDTKRNYQTVSQSSELGT